MKNFMTGFLLTLAIIAAPFLVALVVAIPTALLCLLLGPVGVVVGLAFVMALFGGWCASVAPVDGEHYDSYPDC